MTDLLGKTSLTMSISTVDQVYFALFTERKINFQSAPTPLATPPVCKNDSFTFDFSSIITSDTDLRSSIAATLFPSLFISAASASGIGIPSNLSTCSIALVAPEAQNSAAFLTFTTAQPVITTPPGEEPATSDPVSSSGPIQTPGPPAPAPAPAPAPTPAPVSANQAIVCISGEESPLLPEHLILLIELGLSAGFYLS